MADTFFGFDTSVNNGDHLLPPEDDDCVENEEEEYDALNDETFGALEDCSGLDDWEQQHEQFAEFAESTKHSEHFENSISRLVLDDDDDDEEEVERPSLLSKNSVWAYTPPSNQNGDIFNSSAILSNLQKASKSFIETHVDSIKSQQNDALKNFNHQQLHHLNNQQQSIQSISLSPIYPSAVQNNQLPPPPPKQICTVEELEKSLIKNSTAAAAAASANSTANKQQAGLQPQQQQHGVTATRHQPQQPPSGMLAKPPQQVAPPPPQHFAVGVHPPHPMFPPTRRLPPGLPPLNMPPPMRPHPPHLPPPHHPHHMGMGPPPPPGAPHGMMQHHHHHHHHHVMPPHPFLQAQQHRPQVGPQPPPPGHMYAPGTRGAQFPVNHPFNFGPQPLPGARPMNHQQQQNLNNHPMMNNNRLGHLQQHPSHQQPQQMSPQQQAMNNSQQQHQQRPPTEILSRPKTEQQQQHGSDSGVQTPTHQQHQQYHQQQHVVRDEYAGLMTCREKQWLLNIQMLQLNTGTPYFDDYYYTVFKERKAKNNASKENSNLLNDNNPSTNRNPFQQQQQQQQRIYHNHQQQQQNHNNNINCRLQQQQQHNSNNNNNNSRNQNDHRHQGHHSQQQQQQQDSALTPRIYTPLQFENSLGKLQCGSVTAPRKIIDMDVVAPDKEQGEGGNNSSSATVAKDSRKIKQLLLELEVLYTLLLKAEDLRNPMAISNMEKLREIKQKQRLREIELAPTPEQKQEVLKLFKQESEPVNENPLDYITRIVTNLLQDDQKFNSFLNIRKGKTLLLRLLPHLTVDTFSTQLLDLWSRVLLSIPIVGRRDTANDRLLPQLLPFFRRYVQASTMADILDISGGLLEVATTTTTTSTGSGMGRQESNRSTPLGHQGRTPLYFVLLNRFGVSALVTLLIRTEYLISSDKSTDKQQSDWSGFLSSWADMTATIGQSKIAQPLESIPRQIFTKHCARFNNLLTSERRSLLEKHFVESSSTAPL